MPRILIVSASVGAGHMRAAEAIEAEFARRSESVEVVNRDILQLTAAAFRKVYRDTYLDMVGRAPEVFGWIYQATDRPFQRPRVQMGIEEAGTRKFLKFVREYDPDLVISTHFLPSSLVHHLREKSRTRCRIATVITDFDVHGLWLATPSDHYFVAVEETRAHLLALGIADRQITVSGIPTHPNFAKVHDRAAVCATHDLRADLPTILLSTGGFGIGNVAQLVELLLQMPARVQIIALCGKNAQLQKSLQRMVGGRAASGSVVKVLGFTTAMEEFMAASDLVVGKPGGLTTWESFHKGLVWAVVNPIPGQEVRNTIHLLEGGAGIWCNNLPTLAYKIDALLGDRDRLRTMSANSRRLARPDAGEVIVSKCLELAANERE